MKTHKMPLSSAELRDKTARFFDRYGNDLDQIKQMLEIRLRQLALAYTIDNNLPQEAVQISARVKTLNSFLKKLERKGWPQFYYPTEIMTDIIGARAVCWFLDDCHNFLQLISTSTHLKITGPVEDYISHPKPSGYRAIHALAHIAYDTVQRIDGKISIVSKVMPCEIQIRTKLQDAWGDVTHEFHYKAKNSGVDNKDYESFLSDISTRLANEDRTLIEFRRAYQHLADEKLQNKTREGIRSE